MELMLSMLPNKWVLLGIAALTVFSLIQFQQSRLRAAQLQTAQLELKQAQSQLEMQKQTIAALQRDAVVEHRLMQQAQANIAAIRETTAADLQALSMRDFGSEANVDARLLEHSINKQMQGVLDSISRVSRSN